MTVSRRISYACFIASAPMTTLLIYVVTRPFLPDEIAGMNNMPFVSDDPRSPESTLFSFVSQSIIAAAVAIVALWRTRSGERMPRYGRWAVLYTWMTSAFASAAMMQSIGASDFGESQDRWWVWWLFLPLVIPVAALDRKLTPRARLEQSGLPLPPSSLALGRDERVVWTGSSTSPRTMIGALVLAAAAIAAAVFWSPTALVGLVVSTALFTGSRQSVAIDRRGVTVQGMYRITRHVIPLEEIRAASASVDRAFLRDLHGDADDRTLRGPYLVNRRGPALTVEFGEDQVATISVDDADGAADVLNGLLARLRVNARANEAET
jgi:hypothetical protein